MSEAVGYLAEKSMIQLAIWQLLMYPPPLLLYGGMNNWMITRELLEMNKTSTFYPSLMHMAGPFNQFNKSFAYFTFEYSFLNAQSVCQKCSVDTSVNPREPTHLCKLCSERRETWKKSGAWFYKITWENYFFDTTFLNYIFISKSLWCVTVPYDLPK